MSLRFDRLPTGWIPGGSAWARGERERGIVLFSTFACAWGVALFVWGTTLGLLMLVTAFATQVIGWVDLMRSRTFVPLGRRTPWIAASAALGLGIYIPLLALGFRVAWPGMNGESSADVYLINEWAYSLEEPKPDDLIWYQTSPSGAGRVGRVVASKGQEVEWTRNQLSVAGRPLPLGSPFLSRPPLEFRYQVPDGQLLVDPSDDLGAERLNTGRKEGLVVVECERVMGKAWAKYYPIHERRLIQ